MQRSSRQDRYEYKDKSVQVKDIHVYSLTTGYREKLTG